MGHDGSAAEGRQRLLDENWATFHHLLSRAERHLRRGENERAASAARVAATFAWFNHTGVFASDPLEDLLERLGARVDTSSGATGEHLPGPGVLHVASQVYPTGGHTQMLANWVASDRKHRHTIALTDQRGLAIPEKLTAGGHRPHIIRIDGSARTLLGRARALRALAQRAEMVVLHVHPDDVVPAIALAGRATPASIVYVNHADHVFWAGTRACTTVLCLRRSGQELCSQRRGIATERTAIAVRPLAVRPRTVSRHEAKRRLGIDPDRVVLVTAAAGTKYEPVDGVGFLDLVEPALRASPSALLVAAGPLPEGRWLSLDRDGLGRALGLLPDAQGVFEAADVYLDSYPFASLTSMLEAGSLGVPVLTMRPPTGEPNVLGADTPELDGALLEAPSAVAYTRLAGELITDAALRREMGSRVQQAIAGVHGAGSFHERVEAQVNTPRGDPRPATALPIVRSRGYLDQRVALVQAQTGLGQGRLGARLLNRHHLSHIDWLALTAGRTWQATLRRRAS